MSVPPEMLARCTSAFTSRYTNSKLCGASGLPVERIIRSADNWCVRVAGACPPSAMSARYFALVPNT
jgi:hypothetical protein